MLWILPRTKAGEDGRIVTTCNAQLNLLSFLTQVD